MAAIASIENEALIDFRSALADLYPSTDLMRVILRDCNLSPGDVDLQGQPVVAWHAILEHAHRKRATKVLIARVLHDYKLKLEGLAAAYQTDLARSGIGSTTLSRLSTQDSVDVVVSGLEIAQEKLAERPGGVDLTDAQRAQLAGILEQIDILKVYKDLHDALQRFQYAFGSYKSLRVAAEKFSTSSEHATVLSDFQTRLFVLCTSARAMVMALPAGPTLRDAELLWLGRLDAALRDLTGALKDTASNQALVALNAISHVLRVVPARLSEQIFGAARALPFADLAVELANLAATLPAADPATHQLATSSTAVGVLASSIRARVFEHRRWQEVDNRLANLLQLTESEEQGALAGEFVPIWVEVKLRVKTLVDLDPNGSWGEVITGYSQRIDDRLAGKHIDAEFSLQFEGYVAEAQNRFVEVDLKLKSECAHLVRMGKPLRAILGG